MKLNMFKSFAAAAAAALLLTGCASKVNISEVLQQPEKSEIRTRYHVWYTDAENISALNYMEGSFIPAGTVIEPITAERGSYDIWGTVSVVDGTIKFRTPSDGKEYTMRYDEHLTMIPIEDFIKQLFTVENADAVYSKVPQQELAQVKAGKLAKNMHRESILVLLGPPAKSRTSSMNNQSWLYWKSCDVVFRLIFRGDKVRQIGSLDQIEF